MSTRIDYDPNKIKYHRPIPIQVVEIVLGTWKYRSTYIVRVSSNSTGFLTLELALYELEHQIAESKEGAAVLKANKSAPVGKATTMMGNNLIVEPEPRDGWLKELVMSMRVLEVEYPEN